MSSMVTFLPNILIRLMEYTEQNLKYMVSWLHINLLNISENMHNI